MTVLHLRSRPSQGHSLSTKCTKETVCRSDNNLLRPPVDRHTVDGFITSPFYNLTPHSTDVVLCCVVLLIDAFFVMIFFMFYSITFAESDVIDNVIALTVVMFFVV